MIDKKFMESFKSPGAEHRAKPFWAWNCKLEKDELLWQIDRLKEMGMGGAVIHSRQGMSLPYLGDEFIDLVSACTEKAKKEDMLIWLYDEDRCPSGTAGGIVTSDDRWRGRRVVFTAAERTDKREENPLEFKRRLPESGILLARYKIEFKDGYIVSYKRLKPNESANNLWYAYLEYSPIFPYYNDHSYLDTLCREAVERFIEVTYERYCETVGDEFGKAVPAIFTDEPQFQHQTVPVNAESGEETILPFTDELEQIYTERWGESLIDKLPETVFELADGSVSETRWRYHETVTELFASSFADTIGKWCEKHGIMLTGHVMDEHSLMSQSCAVGEAMRSYRSFQIPGIDILCDAREYSTAKQCQSIVRQKGAPGMTSELYGVTNWNYDFTGYKLQGDWQAAMGVTERVPHLAWVSMEGEGKRDYPATFNYQSPWYREYKSIEDYFSRVNTAMTKGKPCVRVGVIHPIESYWLLLGPKAQTEEKRNELQRNYDKLLDWLLFGMIDFDLINEASLTGDINTDNGHLTVGKMEYDTVIVSGCITLRRSTVKALERFKKSGGRIIISGKDPLYEEAALSDSIDEFTNMCEHIPFERIDLLDALEPCREISLKDENGVQDNRHIYQMRKTDDGFWIFVANGRNDRFTDMPQEKHYRLNISVSGLTDKYRIYLFDADNGTSREIKSDFSNGSLHTDVTLYEHDSLLMYVTDKEVYGSLQKDEKVKTFEYIGRLPQPFAYEMSEPNVLVLDQAKISLDGGEFEDEDDVLNWDNRLCERLNYPKKQDGMIQPWANHVKNETVHSVTLRFIITALIATEAELALEQAENAKIFVNGNKISNRTEGYFTDKCIKKVKLPRLLPGDTVLEVTLPYGRRSSLEWMYLLGNFGVSVRGNRAYLTERQDKIGFGDWCPQGLPFYAGNLTYSIEIMTDEGRYGIMIPQYAAPLLTVSVDGKCVGKIMRSPYKADLGYLTAGRHTVEITAFGNRINAFGQLHNCNKNEWWFGSESWRTSGLAYAYEYQLHKCGVLTAPYLFKKK